MELGTIVLELMSRIQVLEKKVEVLEGRNVCNSTVNERKPAFPAGKISDKYMPLAEYLYETWEKRIAMSYKKIEEILGFVLPDTAYNFPQSYWANTKTHSYASAWMEIGYKAKYNNETKEVTFEKGLY